MNKERHQQIGAWVGRVAPAMRLRWTVFAAQRGYESALARIATRDCFWPREGV